MLGHRRPQARPNVQIRKLLLQGAERLDERRQDRSVLIHKGNLNPGVLRHFTTLLSD